MSSCLPENCKELEKPGDELMIASENFCKSVIVGSCLVPRFLLRKGPRRVGAANSVSLWRKMRLGGGAGEESQLSRLPGDGCKLLSLEGD